MLLSGPDVRRGRPSHGIQWEPGPAAHVLLAGDETAFPAIRNIVSALKPEVHARVVLEVGDVADAVTVSEGLDGHAVTVCRCVGGDVPGALLRAVDAWARDHGAEAAARGEDFYAWLATESTSVARLRDRLRRAGVQPARVHAQGYWHDKVRQPTDRSPEC